MRLFRLALAALLLNACGGRAQAPESAGAPDAVPLTPSETPAVRPPPASVAVIPPLVFEGERREIKGRSGELPRFSISSTM